MNNIINPERENTYSLDKDDYDLYGHEHMIENQDCTYFTRMFGYPVRRELFSSYPNEPKIEIIPFVGY